MVSRLSAFTIAAVWIVLGLAAGITALGLTARGVDEDGLVPTVIDVFRDNLRWFAALVAGCLAVGGLWVLVGARNARSSSALGAQAALIGLAAATVALLLLLIVGQMLGDSVI